MEVTLFDTSAVKATPEPVAVTYSPTFPELALSFVEVPGNCPHVTFPRTPLLLVNGPLPTGEVIVVVPTATDVPAEPLMQLRIVLKLAMT
jgi:hypothetical protein